MGKRIVIALGGNALGNTLTEQMAAVKHTARAIVDLIAEGHEVIISHGNGPQVGMIHHAVNELTHVVEQDFPVIPLSVCVAMSQSYIGYDLQNALREELLDRGIPKPCATVITQVVVDPKDPAFQKPSKPIGRFMSREEAEKLRAEKGYEIMEDAGRGWRQVVASPRPVDVVEKEMVNTLVDAGYVVITVGGGGIPVVRREGRLVGVPAVIDKDYASARLAQLVGADTLVILTAVDRVAINWGKPDQQDLEEMTVAQAEAYCAQGQFAPGSMLPKVQAAMFFAATGGKAIIASLHNAAAALRGESGTRVVR